MLPLSRHTILALSVATALAACQRPHDRPHAVIDAARPTGSLASVDLGVSMLADVENARAAIAAHDAMAAANDIDQAIDYAVRLPDVNSALYPNDAILPGGHAPAGHGSGAAAPAALTSFDTEVALTSAQSAIEGGDLAVADTDLAAIQQRTPPHLAPADLPLLRADECLGLARIAIESEHPTELATQLKIAEAALGAYQGAAHAADARALAAAIQTALKQPGALDHMQSDQLDLWLQRVDGWG
jgi:hypothetical protein